MERRFGDRASVGYFDTSDPQVRSERAALIEEIHDRGLVFPVTVVDGCPVYDGAVSYPAIMRAIDTRIGASTD